jgi:DNA processing protein
MEYWIWLTSLKGIGPITQKRLLAHFKTPNHIYLAAEEELLVIPGIGSFLARSIRQARSLDGAFSVLDQLEKKKIKLLIYHDPHYPELAKAWPEAPIVLFYIGTLRNNSTGIGIVGARRCSIYGKQVAIEAADYLAHQNIPVISGLAKGIDSYAHTACLKAGGYTMAFLGNGLDVFYPKEHRELQAAIIENGVVISKYLPGTTPRPEHFLQRNGLIASWSQKLLVVEAGGNSGALTTAQFAKALNRVILAPPHEIYCMSGQGTNQLLENGAVLYLKAEQLDYSKLMAEAVGIATNKATVKDPDTLINPEQHLSNRKFTAEEAKVIAVLLDSEKTIQQLEALTGINQVLLIEQLAIMELEGLVALTSSGRYSLVDGELLRVRGNIF